MKILFLTSSAPQSAMDATAPFILTMAEDIQALGHSVTILTPHAPGLAREETINGVRFKRFRYAPENWQRLADGGSAMLKLRQSPWQKLLLPCFVLGQGWALWRLLRKERFDVMHAHWLLPQGLVAGLLGRICRLPVVTMIHGADVFGLQHPLWQWCKKQALMRTTKVIVNSSATATAVCALDANVKPEIIPVGATPPEEKVIPLSERKQPTQPLILFVGRLFEGKGLRYALEALAKLPEAQLWVFGDGPDKPEMQALSQQLGISDRVQFKGTAPHQQVLAAMTQAQLLVAPSITTADGWREAQGNAIVEAMLAGLPVVASDSGGIGDAVKHEQTGWLVPEKDVNALAKAMCGLLSDSEKAQTLADAGRAHALAGFTRQASAAKVVALYQQCLKSPENVQD